MLLYKTPEDEVVAVLVRGDHEANEIKVNRVLATTTLTLADSETVTKITAAPIGFAGPVGLNLVRIIADHAEGAMKNFGVGVRHGFEVKSFVDGFVELRISKGPFTTRWARRIYSPESNLLARAV